MKTAIFPGYVGKDTGAVDGLGPSEDDKLYTIEAVINAQVAVLLMGMLSDAGKEAEIFIGSLEDQVKDSIDCDIGIGIHCDAAPRKERPADGFTVFYHLSSGMGQLMSNRLEVNLLTELNGGISSRGVKSEKFYIIRKTVFPCVLLEMGFLTDKGDEQALNQFATQKKIAKALYDTLISMEEEFE